MSTELPHGRFAAPGETFDHNAAAVIRRTARVVLALNLTYFCVEFAVAGAIGSVSLFADSVDFLEDASINALILIGLGWSARARSRLGAVLAGIILVPGLATLIVAWYRWSKGYTARARGARADWLRRARRQRHLRLASRASSCDRRKSVEGRISFGSQRHACQHRDHDRGARDGCDPLRPGPISRSGSPSPR